MRKIVLAAVLASYAVSAVSVTIQVRRDTAANWTGTNPILAAGEIGCETDASPYQCKIGDGTTLWNALPYWDPPVGQLTWNVDPSVCTGDTNTGKLTVTGSNEIVCALDIGGEACGVVRERWIDAAAMVRRSTDGADPLTDELPTNDVVRDFHAFDTITEEGVQFRMTLPRAWDAGTIKAKFYWDGAAGGTATNGVAWGLACQSFADGDALDNAFPASVDTTDDLLTIGQVHISVESADVTIAGSPAVDDLILCEVTRVVSNGNDNLTTDALLYGLNFQYTENTTCPSAW